MRKIIRKKIEEALIQECMDQARYLTYAEKAKKDGDNNLARLFQTISYSERIHSKRFFNLLGELGDSRENLLLCLENEKYQSEEFYPALFELAGLMNSTDLLTGFSDCSKSEKAHSTLFEKALELINSGKQVAFSSLYVCSNCGFTVEGHLPPICDICGMSQDIFKEF